MKSTSWTTLIISLILTLVIAGLSGYVYFQNAYESYLVTPVDSESTARVSIKIDQGETGSEISKKLYEQKLIPSEWAFYKYIKDENIAPKLEAGKFLLKKSYTIPEIAQYLSNARKEETIITIREGLTVEQVDSYLAEKNLLPAGSFMACAKNCTPNENYPFLHSRPNGLSYEGYLFPDTYFIDPETFNPETLFQRMLSNFNNKMNAEMRSEIAKGGHSIHEIVVMASLIEKESRKNSEKSTISGVLWKRLERGMPLGVDATVRYITNKWTEPLTQEDLNIDSPYNTRKNRGMPPGPISNFSIDSLMAAVKPKESDYLFYLHDQKGNIHFAVNNEEHNQNKRDYL